MTSFNSIDNLDDLDAEYSKQMRAYLKSSKKTLTFLCDYFEARANLNNAQINSKNPEKDEDLSQIKYLIAQNKVYTDFVNDIRSMQYNVENEV